MPRLAQILRYYLPSAIAILLLLVAWDLVVRVFAIKEFILPTPAAALAALFDSRHHWVENTLVTTYAVIGAFLLSAVLGVALAVVVVWNSVLERTVLPLLILFNTLPKVALAPLFILWMGYGIGPNIVIAVTISFFPVVINTAAGLASIDPDLLDLARVMRASKWEVFRKIRFPNALPHVFSGLKLNASLSVVGAIVGEFVASEKGLGAIIISAGVTLSTPSIFASLILISALGLGLFWLVALLERLSMPWEFRDGAAGPGAARSGPGMAAITGG